MAKESKGGQRLIKAAGEALEMVKGDVPLISYHHRDDTGGKTHFVQRREDPVPAWAEGIQPFTVTPASRAQALADMAAEDAPLIKGDDLVQRARHRALAMRCLDKPSKKSRDDLALVEELADRITALDEELKLQAALEAARDRGTAYYRDEARRLRRELKDNERRDKALLVEAEKREQIAADAAVRYLERAEAAEELIEQWKRDKVLAEGAVNTLSYMLRSAHRECILSEQARLKAEARVRKLEERLEIDHCFTADKATGEMVRVEVQPERRDNMPDLITCLRADIDMLEEELEASDKSRIAMHRRAQKAEGKLARTRQMLIALEHCFTVRNEANTDPKWFWPLQHIRAALAHARAGSGSGYAMAYTYYRMREEALEGKVKKLMTVVNYIGKGFVSEKDAPKEHDEAVRLCRAVIKEVEGGK